MRELPVKTKNVDVAVDVSAMTVDGGLVVYGVAEDEQKIPTVPTPIHDLPDAAHRIDQIVQTSIDEAPYVEIEHYRLRRILGVATWLSSFRHHHGHRIRWR